VDVCIQTIRALGGKVRSMGARRIFFLQGRGATRGSGGRKSPSGVQGRSPGGGLGAKSPEADGIVLNKDTQTLFPVRRHQ